ncbi:hypothetical protein [Roseateles koreensis]|uniref:HTH cro/C1-type domain-containing protein n=1 Tax=Roseateles koreensis TaxID=2987526 RepID=A0ABT5KZ72_9BURK|nr:hypothetical protein [Roseateles koreensis]MDC8787116.1 hypothetical protein [Roseateles koreensis]
MIELQVPDASRYVNELCQEQDEPILIRLLDIHAAQSGWSTADLARFLGVTVGYLSQLSSRQKAIHRIPDDLVGACADLLSVPAFVVQLLVGRVKPADLVTQPGTSSLCNVELLEVMLADSIWMELVPLGIVHMELELVNAYVCLHVLHSESSVVPNSNADLVLKRLGHFAQQLEASSMDSKQKYFEEDFL